MKTTLSSFLLLIMLIIATTNTRAVNNKEVCNGDSVKIGIDSLPAVFLTGNQSLIVKWNGTVYANTQYNRYVKPSATTIYVLDVKRGNNHYKDTFNVVVRPRPTVPAFAGDTDIAYGEVIRLDLNAAKSAGVKYTWQHGVNDSVLMMTVVKDTTCLLTVSNAFNCEVSRSYQIMARFPVYVTVKDSVKFKGAQIHNGYVKLMHAGLDSLFKKYKVISVHKVNYYASAKSRLNRVFKITCKENVDSFFKELSNFDSLFSSKRILQPREVYKASSPGTHPNDFASYLRPHALAAMRLPEAWQVTTGNPAIRIAILEDGYASATHEDLVGKVAPRSTNSMPTNVKKGHTTGVAGVIAAISNNNKGIVGAAYNMEVTSYYSSFLIADQLANALEAIYSDGLRVVSISMVTPTFEQDEQDVINQYYEKGMLIIAAADNTTTGNLYRYPASYDHVISVAGVSTESVMTPGPNYPSQPNDYSVNFNNISHAATHGYNYNDKVDISAPAIKVGLTADLNRVGLSDTDYGDGNGTSFATPLVASVCGLILSVNPCLTNAEVEYIIKATARAIPDDVSSNPWYQKLGSGFIDAKAAVDMASTYGATTLTVGTGQTITLTDQTRTFSNIIIESGGILSLVRSTVYINTDGKIRVKQGAKLIANESTITMRHLEGICNDNSDWYGIIIEGDPTKEQSNLTYHGVVNLLNSTVSNSQKGIIVGTGNNNGGGVLIANGCNFNNRDNSIYFYKYLSPSGLNNRSVITRCNFEIPFYFPTIVNPFANRTQVALKITGIKGLKIKGCSFAASTRQNGDNYFFILRTAGYDRVAVGIQSINSSYSVEDDKAVTSPYQPQARSRFTLLDQGIYHTGFSPDQLISVTKTDFNSCGSGIYLSGASGCKIYRNNFYFKLYDISNCISLTKTCGISAYNALGAIITENHFENVVPGIYTSSQGLNTNCNWRSDKNLLGSVMNITSNPLMLGSFVTHNDADYAVTGGQYEVDNISTAVRCNDYDHHLDGITVYGINPLFGNCKTDRVDRLNTFTNKYTLGDVCNFNLSGNSFDYLISSSNPKPPTRVGYNNSLYSVNLINTCVQGTIQPFDCLSRWEVEGESSSRGGDVPYGKGPEVFATFDLLKQKKLLIANGAQESLLNSVANGNYSNGTAVYNELINYSPYLSNNVLHAVLTYGSYFSSSQLSAILAANSRLDEELFNLAQSNPILTQDDAAMNNLVLAQSNQNQREIVELQIKDLTNEYYGFRTAMVDSILFGDIADTLNSTIYYYLQQLTSALEELDDEDDKYIRLSLYTRIGNSTKAISEQLKFDNGNLQEKAFTDLIQFNSDWQQGSIDSAYLASHHARILEIGSDSTLFASATANGILEVLYDEHRFRRPYSTEETVTLGKKTTALAEVKGSVAEFKLYPNPTNGRINLLVENSSGMQGSIVKIFDMKGDAVKQLSWASKSNELIIDISDFQNGIYIVKVLTPKGIGFTERLIYVK